MESGEKGSEDREDRGRGEEMKQAEEDRSSTEIDDSSQVQIFINRQVQTL